MEHQCGGELNLSKLTSPTIMTKRWNSDVSLSHRIHIFRQQKRQIKQEELENCFLDAAFSPCVSVNDEIISEMGLSHKILYFHKKYWNFWTMSPKNELSRKTPIYFIILPKNLETYSGGSDEWKIISEIESYIFRSLCLQKNLFW